MKVNKSLMLCMVQSFALTVGAMAGEGSVGNGGGAWVCSNDPKGQDIRWAESVDRYEARMEFMQTPLELLPSQFNNDPFLAVRNVLDQRVKPIDFILYNEFLNELNKVESNFDVKPVILKKIDDSLYRIEPDPLKECINGFIQYVQVANYTKYGKILVSNSIYNHSKFDFNSKVELIGHEMIYSFFRKKPYFDSNSSRARGLNGAIFSTIGLEDLKKQIYSSVYNGVREPVNVESRILPTGESIYFQGETSKLAAPFIMDGNKYHIELPVGSDVYLDSQSNRIQYVVSYDYNKSWVDLFGSRVPFYNNSIIFFDVNGDLEREKEIHVASSKMMLGGALREIPDNTKFTFGIKGEQPEYLTYNPTNPFYLSLSPKGSNQNVNLLTTRTLNNSNLIYLDDKGYVTEGSFVNLKVLGINGVEYVSGHLMIRDGFTFIQSNKFDEFKANFNGFKVRAVDEQQFCYEKSDKKFPAEALKTEGIDNHQLGSPFPSKYWDFEKNKALPDAEYVYVKKIKCFKMIPMEILK